MSSLIVEVSTIDEVLPHPNADNLALAVVKGWQTVIGKDQYKKGDKVIYIPPDSVLPTELSDKLGVTKYLSKGRVRCIKLRGEMSFGLIIDVENKQLEVGTDVAILYGISKWEPPLRLGGKSCSEHPMLQRYTDIENLRNFPNIFNEGEPVILTEKIHGSNCRIGLINGEKIAGTHRTQRVKPNNLSEDLYWFPFTLEPINKYLEDMSKEHECIIIFGEMYGNRIQNLTYGLNKQNEVGFAAFDILIDGKYLSSFEFAAHTGKYQIPIVPIVDICPYGFTKVKELSMGNTLLRGGHIREGIVIKPIEERTHPKIGRVVLKMLNDAYLLKEHGDFKE